MSRATSLREIACSNKRSTFAQVLRSFRRTGQRTMANVILRHAREHGTYPPPLRLGRGYTAAPFA